MMSRVAWLLLCAATLAAALPSRSRRQAQLEPFTLEETVPSQYGQTGFTGTWISDTEFTFTVPGVSGINLFDVSTLTQSTLVSADLLAQLNTTSPIYSPDRQYILAPSDVQSVYRYSSTARFALYNVNTGVTTNVADHQRLELCIFNSVTHALAYVLDNDVYYLPADAQSAIRLTFDGVPGVIYNGHTDWVYEEDVFYSGQALWFSPDGTRLAVASFDDTLVEPYSYYYFSDISDPEDVYPELVDLKYPKVGTTNPSVTLRWLDLPTLVANPNTVAWQPLAAPAQVTADHVLGGVRWITATEVAAHWLNRRQNYSIINICNVVTGTCVQDIRSQPDGWVPAALPTFSRAGDFYVGLRWSPPQADGAVWQHLHVTMRIGDELWSQSVSPGDVTIDSFVGMDEENVLYYFTRTVSGEPWSRQIFTAGSNTACLSCSIVMPQGGACTWASATLSIGGRYLSITCSSTYEPSVVVLMDALSGTVVATWEDNSGVRERLANKLTPQRIITTVPLPGGYDAPVRLYLPPDLDPENPEPGRTYALIYYVYSGPNTQTVTDNFLVGGYGAPVRLYLPLDLDPENLEPGHTYALIYYDYSDPNTQTVTENFLGGYHSYLTTNRSIIYMMADGRGSGLKGQQMLYEITNRLGTVEIEDHLIILRQVLERYPWIDATRVGMWGSSYGGYATLLTHVIDDDNMIRCGVSSAPVTSWLYYNTMYTERYMGLPTEEDNLAGYLAGDLTELAEKLRGKDFYIMHGNADDNVHYQNAAKLMRRLQQLDIPFEQMSYPDEAHSLAGVTRHRYNTMEHYWTRCLDLPAV